MRAVYAWACRWVFAAAGMMLAGLWLTAPALVTAWLGPGHAESAAVARALALLLLCVIVPGPATAVARGGGFPGLEAVTYVSAFVLNVLLCLWLVPQFGPLGAAWAMGVSIAAAGAWVVLSLHRWLGVSTRAWLPGAALRVLAPVLAAVALVLAGLGGLPAGRGEAVRALAIQAAAFVPLALLLTWSTGDARLVLERARARLTEMGFLPGAAGGGS